MSDARTPSVPPVPESGEPVVPAAPPVAGTPAPKYGEFAPVESAQEPAAAAPGQPTMYSGTAESTTSQGVGYPPAPAAPQGGLPAQAPAASGYPGYPQSGGWQQAQPGVPAQGYPAGTYPQAAQPVYGQPGFGGTPVAKRRTWDVVLTIILLVLGLGGMLLGVLYGVIFSSPELLDDTFRQQGLGGFDGDIGAIPLVLIVSHVVLYLVAAGLSILLLVKKKIAFYVPLIAGVVAAVIFWGAMFALIMSDPDFAATYGI
jgi:hypothetical protein